MAIDSDHNMDFIDLLGYTFTRQTPTFKESYDDLFYFLGESPKLLKPRHLVQKYLGQKKFSLFPMDDFTTKIAIEYEKMLCLGVVGL